jgi:hypothetical protein
MDTTRSTILRITELAVLATVLCACGGGGEDASTVEHVTDKRVAAVSSAIGGDPVPSVSSSPLAPSLPLTFAQLMRQYTPFDINGDGRHEINSLEALFASPQPYVAQPNGVVVVLVDPRLVSDEPGIGVSGVEIKVWMALLETGMFNDGYFPYFVKASVYDGSEHQDGRTLLALRRFLKSVRANYPLAGVLLVGSFPDAGIVRSVFAKSSASDMELTSGSIPNTQFTGAFVQLFAEYLTPRAEIVLGDLDGNWEALYREKAFVLPRVKAAPPLWSSPFPRSGQVLQTQTYDINYASFEDVFYIQDHQVAVSETSGTLRLSIASVEEPSPEVSLLDRLNPNRIARPEIFVSRINPRSVAVMPVAPLDLDGRKPLDGNGAPQALRYASAQTVTWARDRTLERRLVADYVARSHRFRLGSDNNFPFRTSAITAKDSGLMSPSRFNDLLRRASGSFSSPVAADQATLLGYVDWLRKPAVLRGIAAHSNAVNSEFGSVEGSWPVPISFDLMTLEFMAGGPTRRLWRWVGRWQDAEYRLEPSFAGLDGNANFHLHRTLWENKTLSTAGQMFVVHEGCEVMRFANADKTEPYNGLHYGQRGKSGGVTNGESLLFYGNGLGLMARNKVFNDAPVDALDEVNRTGRFGYGWRAYFMKEAAKDELNERTADPTVIEPGSDRRWRSLQRKRSYFWNTIGDPTLKIRYQ